MRVLLEEHQHVGLVLHALREVSVAVQFSTYSNLGAHERTDMREQIPLAVFGAVGDHRTMQPQRDDVHGQSLTKLLEDFVAQPLVNRLRYRTAGHRVSASPLHHRPTALPRSATTSPQRSGGFSRLVRVLPGPPQHGVFEGTPASGQG